MFIKEAIDRADALCQNTYSQEDKVKWLSSLDNLIYNKIFKTHAYDGELPEFTPYDENTDVSSTELLVPDLFGDLYVYWLISHIYLYNQEIDQYNNFTLIYNKWYDDFVSWYNRTHMPLQKAREVYF